jgi:hypothetical protein
VAAIRSLRAQVNKQIEELRSADQLGSSLQAELDIEAAGDLYQQLASLGEDLKFVLIVSAARVREAEETRITVTPSTIRNVIAAGTIVLMWGLMPVMAQYVDAASRISMARVKSGARLIDPESAPDLCRG